MNDVVKIETAAAKRKAPSVERVTITPPNFAQALVRVRGTAPYVQHKFSEKSRNQMIENQKQGSQSTKGKARQPKDFDAVYEACCYRTPEGWYGIPCGSVRSACISACRLAGFKMTIAKLSLFVDADGFDKADGTPLIKITKGAPERRYDALQNTKGGHDIRCRPMWRDGWEANIRIKWDGDQFSATDVMNLLMRVGAQVGLGEGRADSRKSTGCGWGHFEVVGTVKQEVS